MGVPVRLRWAAASLVVVAAGLASRHPMAPSAVRAWAGDVLYAVMAWCLVGVVAPGASAGARAIAALVFCGSVEVSQLVGWAPLDAVRAHRVGALVLGRGFLWSDIALYAVGIVSCLAFELLRTRPTGPGPFR